MSDYDLDEGAVLTKVNRYELERGEKYGRIFIDAHKVLSDEKEGMFYAIPNLVLGGTKQEYIASGETEEEALKKCLKLIKGVPTHQIVEKNYKVTS